MAEDNCLEPWRRLYGKVVMVTGASSGIGRECCLDLAKAGCKIVAAARRMELLKSLCHQINSMNSLTTSLAEDNDVRAVALELDVSAKGHVIEACMQKAWDVFGRIDALVNNAGVRGSVCSPLDLSEEEWNSTLVINTAGSWLVSKYLCALMLKANHKGSIINITSVAGLSHGQYPGGTAYAASKAALNAVTRVMALELGKYKIRVNAIAPGIFKSTITEELMKKQWLNKVLEKTIPLKTYGTVDPALTTLVRYLIHDSSEYVSGNVYTVDAGSHVVGVPIFSSL